LKDLIDPGLGEKGANEAKDYGRDIAKKNLARRITHVFCSPMKRVIEAAIHSYVAAELPDDLSIVLLPELQNIDHGPNGTGAGLNILRARYASQNFPELQAMNFTGQIEVDKYLSSDYNDPNIKIDGWLGSRRIPTRKQVLGYVLKQI
jgi:hypothetical protein